MAFKWLVGYSTKADNGPSFRTKKAAIAWGQENLEGTFIVWKAEAVVRRSPARLSLRSLRLV